MKQLISGSSAGTGRSCSEAGTQLVGGDAAVPSGEGMQPSLHKSGFSAVLATCCAKLQLGPLSCIIILQLACSGAGLPPADCLEGTKIAPQAWEQGGTSTSSGEVSPGKELIPCVPDGIRSVPLHGIDTPAENLKQWSCVSWKP